MSNKDVFAAFAIVALSSAACATTAPPTIATSPALPPQSPMIATSQPPVPAASTPASAAASTPATKPCSEPEHRQMDFWIGDWDVAIRSRTSLDSDQWAEARGTNHVASILGGCVIEETFSAPGPGTPWSGRSVSQRVLQDGKWHQTWVDDQGSYMTFIGERVGAELVLTGVPRAMPQGGTTLMRMVYFDIAHDHLKWRWEGTRDGGKTWAIAMTIDYTRRPAAR